LLQRHLKPSQHSFPRDKLFQIERYHKIELKN
jgi:hypothetical protein